MNTVIIASDVFDPASRAEIQTDDVCGLIRDKFPVWPKTARIYHEYVAANFDVTPTDEAGVERLKSLHGRFYVVVSPGEFISISSLIVSLLFSALSYVVGLALAKPSGFADSPVATQRNIAASSPNNELAQRTNRARLHGRIPDIYGTVRSTPDLIAVPYSIFVDHTEVEIAYMCVGRGEYEISDIKDGDTPVEEIDGASVEIYGPSTSPNSGDAPQLSVGSAIGTQVASVARLTAVNGQVLLAPNSLGVQGVDNIRFVYPNIIEANISDLDWNDYFNIGDIIDVAPASYDNSAVRSHIGVATFDYVHGRLDNFSYPVLINGVSATIADVFVVGSTIEIVDADFDDGTSFGNLDGTYTISAIVADVGTGISYMDLVSPELVNAAWSTTFANYTTNAIGDTALAATFTAPAASVDLAGTYTISGVSPTQITLSSPASVNSDWNDLQAFGENARTAYIDPLVIPFGGRWVGPFRLGDENLTKFICNFVALSGLYKDDGEAQRRTDVEIEIEATPVDAEGAPTGFPQTFSATVIGSGGLRTTRALTAEFTPTVGGFQSVRWRRSTAYDYAFNGQVVDEVKLRDCFSWSPIAATEFGNVTTVQSMTFATSGALSVKERKLSMLASRKIPVATRGAGGEVTGFTAPAVSSSAGDILVAVSLDAYIGRRTVAELDLDSIYQTIDDIADYFGSAEYSSFNYTFDKSGLSYEETVALIAKAAFSVGYRRGRQLKLSFERQTNTASLLFNHRNKLPKSEVRTIRWGMPKDYDGVNFSYVDPSDDAIVTIYIPSDRSATQPQTIESIGVRNEAQATVHAWRAYNKLVYQNETVQFDGLQEADLVVLQERILVADNTRSGTIDGEVVEQDVLTLKLSQKAPLDDAVDYTIFLQHADGSTESMSVSAGDDDYHAILERAPATPLSLDVANAVRATYQIVRDDASRTSAFMLSERRPKDNFTSTVTAINYDARYYQNDLD